MTESRMRPSIFALALAAVLCMLSAGAALAGGNGHGHGPVVGTNVRVNDPQQLFPNDLDGRNTTTLAVSSNGDDLLAGWDDFQGFCGLLRPCPAPATPGISGFAFSTDGGTTWTDGGTPFPILPSFTAGHPWVDRGGKGDDEDDDGHHDSMHGDDHDGGHHGETFYFASRMQAGTSGSTGLAVHRGHFGAGTFVFDDAHFFTPPSPLDFFSRQAIAAAKDNSDDVYLVQSDVLGVCGIAFAGGGQIEVFRSHDAGDTWQGPAVVSADLVESCGDSGTLQVAPVPAIGPKGELYLVWQYGPYIDVTGAATPTSQIAFSRSLDGGVTFSTPQLLVTTNNMRENPPVGYGKNRMNDQPRLAVATTGSHKGRVYVTFYQSEQQVTSPITDQSAVSSDVYILWSDNKGATWSTPKRITTAVPATGVKRFWPTVSVRNNGDVDVVYLQSLETQVTPDPVDVECSVLIGGGLRRTGPLSSLVDTYLVQSRDGGAHFDAPVRVSEQTSNWCTAAYLGVGALYSNFGDYLGIATTKNRTFTVWPDSRNGVADVFFAGIDNHDDD